jgi:hypothetical protein
MGGFLGGGSPRVRNVPVRSSARSEPWDVTHEYFTDEGSGILDQSRSLFQKEKQFAPFNTYTDFDPATLRSLDETLAIANRGTPLITDAQNFVRSQIAGGPNAAIDYLTPTARGDFLGANNALLQDALGGIYDRVNSQFAAGGRGGSSYHADAMARGAAPAVLQNLQQERQNQLNAANLVGSLEQQDLLNRFAAAKIAPGMQREDMYIPSLFDTVGARREGKAAEVLAHELNKFNFGQNERDVALNQYLNRIGHVAGLGGQTSSVTNTPLISSGDNKLGNIASVVGTGLKLASFLCDYRLKDDIEDLPDDALSKVKRLRPVSYHYRAEYGFDPRPVKGFLAHEVQEVIPEAVANEKDGQFAQLVDLNTLLSTVAKATQELAEKVERLEKKLEKFDG